MASSRLGDPYSRVFFFLSKTLDILLSPLSWSVALVVAGLVGQKSLARRRAYAGAGLAVLLLFSLEPVANLLERSLETRAAKTYRPEVTYDAVILLGGLVERSSLAGPPEYNDNIERLLVTYDLLRNDHAHFAILSGGVLDAATPTFVEARVLDKQLVDWGIAPERLVVEAHSRNTHDNAVESQRITAARGWTRLLLVTSAFHMPRALACFRAVGLSVDALPVDYRAYDPAHFRGSWLPRSSHLDRSTGVLREWFGHGIYRLRGYAR